MDNLIEKAAEILASAKKTAALTGAGISVESGIPPFRGKGGLWEKVDPMEFATIEAFMRDPAKVWRVLVNDMKEVVAAARPNDAHLGLARLESMGRLDTIITQNVDGLHQAAGSSDVIEFHGTFAWQRCLACGQRIPTAQVNTRQMPPRCACGGIYRPECVFFGEMIPPASLARSQQVAAACNVMLVIGTSATVQPAAMMPVIAKSCGAVVIEINPEPTPLSRSVSDTFIKGDAGEIVRRIVERVEDLLPGAARNR
jgi:NAD-dependent deacetylase